jgi:N-acetylglutamate synthase-like GNAT family acetyltransferase
MSTAVLSALPDWSGDMVTRTGYSFFVRPTTADDAPLLSAFFDKLSPEDLRFRFLSGMRHVSDERIQAMTDVDHEKTENFLAFDRGTGNIIASGMLAADEKLERAEVAVSILPDYKQRGISWTLLNHIARFAQAKGIKSIESLESRSNHVAIELEREMGFTAIPCPGDATLLVVRAQLGN